MNHDGTMTASDGTTALVVDDDDDIRDLLALCLSEAGYRVLTAAHGKAALALLDGVDAPCVLLLDLMMPVMSGWDVLEVLRRTGRTERIAVVVFSANDVGELGQLTGVVVVQKPARWATLLKAIESATSRLKSA